MQTINLPLTYWKSGELDQFAPANGKKSCKKGIPCGGACISAKKTCKSQMSSATQEKAKQVKAKLGSGGSKKAKQSAQASTTPKEQQLQQPKTVEQQEKSKTIKFVRALFKLQEVNNSKQIKATAEKIAQQASVEQLRGIVKRTSPSSSIQTVGKNKKELTAMLENNLRQRQNMALERGTDKVNATKYGEALMNKLAGSGPDGGANYVPPKYTVLNNPKKNSKAKISEKINKNKKKGAETIDEMNRALKDLAGGKSAKLSGDAELSATQWMTQQGGYGTTNLAKQYKMLQVAKNLTDNESAALALWLGSGYTQMSKQIWMQEANPNFKPDPKILAASVLAAQALHKLPKQTADEWAQRMNNWSLDGSTLASAKKAANGTWNRYMKIDEAALQGFVQKYKDGKGKEIVEGNFMGITHLKEPKMSYFSSGANVVYRIKPKTDGTSQGKYVDDFKNGNKEGEILYPPGTKFRVKKVTEVKNSPVTQAEKDKAQVLNLIMQFEAAYAVGDEPPVASGKAKKIKELTGLDVADAIKQKKKFQPKGASKGWHPTFQPNGYLIELEEV